MPIVLGNRVGDHQARNAMYTVLNFHTISIFSGKGSGRIQLQIIGQYRKSSDLTIRSKVLFDTYME